VIGRPILLLDEPTVSLDAASVARFAAWLRDRHLGQGGLAVIATHVPLGLERPSWTCPASAPTPGRGDAGLGRGLPVMRFPPAPASRRRAGMPRPRTA
jgi:heme exporter protein A